MTDFSNIPSVLYHGTSKAGAEGISTEGVIRPGARAVSETSMSDRIYLEQSLFVAIHYAYARTVRIDDQGRVRAKPLRTYNPAFVFEIATENLDKALFCEGNEAFVGEVAYRGVIPRNALKAILTIPMSTRLKKFAQAVADSELESYIGKDVGQHLGIKRYENPGS